MKTGRVSRTALGAAAGRAIESSRSEDDRLFEDRFARGFLTVGYRVIVDLLCIPWVGAALLAMRERLFPGIMGNVLCRTRFIDDALTDALEEGLDQVVILGAGFDSRAYRISGVDRVPVFEVDHPATQGWKRERLERMLGSLPSHVTFVPIDFDRPDLDAAMTAAAFRTGLRTFFIWEGVTQYISAEAIDVTLQYVVGSAAVGSTLVFTYIDRGVIDGAVRVEGGQRLMSALERQGEPWVFGIDPYEITAYLGARGLSLGQDAGGSAYRRRYLDPLGRRMGIFEGERVVLARVGDHVVVEAGEPSAPDH
jgi:methyltransferase (TIGR00027 family)